MKGWAGCELAGTMEFRKLEILASTIRESISKQRVIPASSGIPKNPQGGEKHSNQLTNLVEPPRMAASIPKYKFSTLAFLLILLFESGCGGWEDVRWTGTEIKSP
ncbi:MAG: hypothetical protein R2879_06810 [Saprospiraceae bacterium]